MITENNELDLKYNKFHVAPTIQKRLITNNNFTYRETIRILSSIIKKKELHILDYGCGVGTIDFFLANQGHKVLGVDVSPKAISACIKSAKAIGISNKTKFRILLQKILKLNFTPPRT